MSASYSWPAGLPQVPQASGYSESIGTNVNRLPMDSGMAKIRFSSLRGDRLSVQYIMTSSELSLFEAFIKDTIRYTRRFYFPHPRRRSVTNSSLPVGFSKIDPIQVTSSVRSTGAYYASGTSLAYAEANELRYVHGSGVLVEDAAVNLATRSITPENWVYNGSTMGAAVSCPDPSSTARQLIETNVSSAHNSTFAGTNLNSGTRAVASVYVKGYSPGVKRYVSIMFPSAQYTTNKGVCFDPATGLAGTPVGITDFGSEKVGDYYRIWAAAAPSVTSSTAIQIRLATTINSLAQTYTGNTGAGIIMWGRQVEERTSGGPTSLIRSTTTIRRKGC